MRTGRWRPRAGCGFACAPLRLGSGVGVLSSTSPSIASHALTLPSVPLLQRLHPPLEIGDLCLQNLERSRRNGRRGGSGDSGRRLVVPAAVEVLVPLLVGLVDRNLPGGDRGLLDLEDLLLSVPQDPPSLLLLIEGGLSHRLLRLRLVKERPRRGAQPDRADKDGKAGAPKAPSQFRGDRHALSPIWAQRRLRAAGAKA